MVFSVSENHTPSHRPRKVQRRSAIVALAVCALVLSGHRARVAFAQDIPAAATRPAATRPAQAAPVSPFGHRALPPGKVGTVLLSDGTRLAGYIHLQGKTALRVFDRDRESWVRVPLMLIDAMRVAIESETREREWRWREGGLDDKVYTGRVYVWRKYLTTLDIVDGSRITGDLSGPLYVRLAGEERSRRYLFHMRNKTTVGESADALLYMKEVRFGVAQSQPAATQPATAPARRPEAPASQPARREDLTEPPDGD